MFGFVSTALLLLSICFLEAAIGPRGADLRALLALLAMAPVLIVLASTVEWRSRVRTWAAMGALAFAVLWHTTSGAPQYFSLSAALGLLALAQRPEGTGRKTLAVTLCLTALAFAAFVGIRDHLTLWPVLYPLSRRVSTAAAGLFGRPSQFGPSYSGAWIFVAFLAAFVARAAVAVRKSAWRTSFAFLLLILLSLAAYGAPRLALALGAMGPYVQFLGWRVFLFALLLLPLVLIVRACPVPGDGSKPAPSAPEPRRAGTPAASLHRSRSASWVWSLLAVAGLLLLTWSTRVPSTTGRVLLDARGDFSLEPLEWGVYGPQVPRGASIATLPQLLEAHGFSLTVHDTIIDEALLSEHDVLIVMNRSQELSSEEHAAVWRFVEQGGGMLVLGDHTNIRGIMGPMNALLEPSGVSLAFDSAIPQVRRWTWYGCIRTHPHPVVRGIRDEADVKISVGASLDLPFRALPLLTGRDAFSDAGDWDNEQGAYLGNMRYDPGETLGDLPLAAAVRHGKGKVVVFGDTSSFQRSAIYNDHEFVTRIFTYLASPGTAVAPPVARIAGAIALSVGLIGLAIAGAAALPALVLVGVIGTAGLVTHDLRARVPLPPLTGDRPVAYVDLAHGNRVDRHSGDPTGIGGFVDHLWRGGYLPLGMGEFDAGAVADARIFATVAPTAPFSTGEREALRQFVDDGGLLLVACGYEESRGAEGLLSDFGYGIGATPIGAAHQAITHVEGQRAMMHESWPVLFPDERAAVLISCWGYPLITFERVGRGGLIVIGDSFFLCDVMLESVEAYVEPNINFLRAVLEMAAERSESEDGS